MSFRSRLLTGFLMLALVPLAAFGLGLSRETTQRLAGEFDRQARISTEAIQAELRRESAEVDLRLAALAVRVAADDRLRRAILGGGGGFDRSYLLDFASIVMEPAGLSMLQLQDSSGRILSSGHFRNEFDRLVPELANGLGSLPEGAALTTVRTADSSFLAFVRMKSVQIGEQSVQLVGGVQIGDRFLASLEHDDAISVSLEWPGDDPEVAAGIGLGAAPESASDSSSEPDRVVAGIRFPFLSPTGVDPSPARFVVRQSLAELTALQRSLRVWFAIGFGGALIGALILAAWVSSRLSRPLEALSNKTSRLDLDRLDIDFRSDRSDEIGDLSRLLQALTGRLRTSASRLRDAERQVTRGEMARQVNHDIKNGLVPIRNVVEHLTEVTQDEPDQLGPVFAERGKTLISGISYLEDLASNYSKLVPRVRPERIDVNGLAREIAADGAARGCDLKVDPDVPALTGDPVALRRILENLVANAREAVSGSGGGVRVSTAPLSHDGVPVIRISVEDDGPGLSSEEQDRVFEDFFSTREGGTGLGLSIVRRLVTDMGGRIRVESEPGHGARFIVELPAEPSSEHPADPSPRAAV
ncbi:MAG: HAMP domain-containing sensor histidine kinase [Gemmatimonadota bacterium]